MLKLGSKKEAVSEFKVIVFALLFSIQHNKAYPIVTFKTKHNNFLNNGGQGVMLLQHRPHWHQWGNQLPINQ
jgi:hypothetical protein